MLMKGQTPITSFLIYMEGVDKTPGTDWSAESVLKRKFMRGRL